MPAYVLIHGGAVTGAFWDRLVPVLDGPAIAPDFPGRRGRPGNLMGLTVDQCADAVLDDLRATDPHDLDDLVVVAHSSGGLVVPGVVAGARAMGRTVRHVVLSAASIPPEGGTGLDCMKPSHRDRIVAAVEWARREGTELTTPGPPDDPETVRDAYGEPLDDDALAFVVDPVRNVRDSMNVYFQPVRYSEVGDVPVTYVRNERDRPVPLSLQNEMIGRLDDVVVVTLDSGHIPAVTQPVAFAAVVSAAVAAGS